MSLEDLNSISTKVYPMPDIPQALGELITELAVSEPDAIVVDRTGRQIIVYPQGSASERPELTEASITSLLAEFIVEMLGNEIDSIDDLLVTEDESTHLAVFCHPTQKEKLCSKKTQIKVLPTKVMSPNFLLLCCRGETEKYKLRGAMLKTS